MDIDNCTINQTENMFYIDVRSCSIIYITNIEKGNYTFTLHGIKNNIKIQILYNIISE